MADWLTDKDAPRYTVMDQPANRQAWRRGRKRQWIENLFRDWKSYGFDLPIGPLWGRACRCLQ
jgi:hypothetical protein